tara:strand:+ start:869 stop:1240 length:372 start_codon:yes stop_codon:yes gene_type:complete
MNNIKSFIVLLAIDSIYLYSMKNHYSDLITKIQGKGITMRMVPTFFVYLLLYLGWYNFIFINKSKMTQKELLLNAFILGFVIYGVYELTNYAIIDDWTLKTVLIDTVWGGILLSLLTLVSLYL